MAIRLVPCDDATPLLARSSIYAPRTFQGCCPTDPEVELKPIPEFTRKETRASGGCAFCSPVQAAPPSSSRYSDLTCRALGITSAPECKYLDITCLCLSSNISFTTAPPLLSLNLPQSYPCLCGNLRSFCVAELVVILASPSSFQQPWIYSSLSQSLAA